MAQNETRGTREMTSIKATTFAVSPGPRPFGFLLLLRDSVRSSDSLAGFFSAGASWGGGIAAPGLGEERARSSSVARVSSSAVRLPTAAAGPGFGFATTITVWQYLQRDRIIPPGTVLSSTRYF